MLLASYYINTFLERAPLSWFISLAVAFLLSGLFLRCSYLRCSPYIVSSDDTMKLCTPRRLYVYLILISVVLAYAMISGLLYCTWLSGDSWWLQMMSQQSFSVKFHDALWRYFGWVGRIGEQIGVWWSLSPSRWQFWLLTPVFVTVFPFVVKRAIRAEMPMASPKGIIFFWLCIVLSLIGVSTEPAWRNYTCYFAHITYLWPTIWSIFFLSIYTTNRETFGGRYPFLNGGFALFLGVISGWGTECFTATVFPLLLGWSVYHLVRRLPMSYSARWGIAGFIIGAALLFGSGAAAGRAGEHTILYKLPYDELLQFVYHLDWSKVSRLNTGSIPANLIDVPLHLRVFFAPYLLDFFWNAVSLTAAFAATIILLHLLFNRSRFYSSVKEPMLWITLSCVMALSYLGGCIPSHYSFLPSCFIAICGALLLWSRLGKWTAYSVGIFLISYGMVAFIVPALIEGIQYKPYEVARASEIRRQASLGIKHIHLNAPYPTTPRDPLHIITSEKLTRDPENIGNRKAVWGLGPTLGIERISQD